MKARPILMNTPMVQATWEGRKTQTRRVVKPQPYVDEKNILYWRDPNKRVSLLGNHNHEDISFIRHTCPHGKVGDLLYVRENLYFDTRDNGARGIVIYSASPEVYMNPFGQIANSIDASLGICTREEAQDALLSNKFWKQKPSIHMPRWASRLTLEITDIRVERLQDISKKDAIAEGVVKINRHYLMDPNLLKQPVEYANGTVLKDEAYWGNDNPVGAFASFFEKLSGSESWNQNPWVWVIEFKAHKCNVDEFLKRQVA